MLSKKNFSWIKDLCLITMLLSILFFIFSGSRPLMSPDEGRYAEIAREMVATHDYLTPRLNGIKYFEKPPLFYWMESLAIAQWGTDEWSLRTIPVILGVLGCLLAYISGRYLFDRTSGWLGSLTLAASPLYFTYAHFISPDLTLSLCLNLSLLLFLFAQSMKIGWQRNSCLWGMYIFSALAVLTKGLIGIVFPAMIIFIWVCVLNRWLELKSYRLFSGLLIFLAITLPWHGLVQLQNPEFGHFYFYEQHFLRYLTDYAQRNKPLWFFSACVLIGFFPWIIFLLRSVFTFSPQKFIQFLINPTTRHDFFAQLQKQSRPLFLWIWVISILIFFTFSRSQLIPYALPLMLPLALLTGHVLSKYWEAFRTPVMNFSFIVICGIGIIMSLLGFFLIHPLKTIHYDQLYWYLALIVMLFGMVLSGIFYYRKGFKAGFISLFSVMITCFVSLNLAYVSLDPRSIKPLASTLKPLLTPQDQVISFGYYYQDLPVYLERTVTLVEYQGELAFGMRHQNTEKIMISESNFWQQWKEPNRQFMIMSFKDYQKYKAKNSLYLLAYTHQNTLVTNLPLPFKVQNFAP